MSFKVKTIFCVLLAIILIMPFFAHAQNTDKEIFQAKVLQILDEKQITREDGSTSLQQNLKLKGLEGEWENKEFEFFGISEIDVISANTYKKGDKVMVNYIKSGEKDLFYVVDYVRRAWLYFLAGIFALVVILIGRLKGLRALISLLISFLIIIKFILPQILAGANPLLIGVLGCFAILVCIIYITEGINKKSHLAILSVLICLFIVYLLSWLFTYFAKLTGMAQDEVMYLVSAGHGMINFQGLLLVAILIGTLGVLDDVVISQIEAVKQIRQANKKLPSKQVFQRAFKIGNSHFGAVINTLFLAYVGASLPLLLLFVIQEPPFLSFAQIINNEIIATEIIRALIGSIGIALAVPLSTFLAVCFNKKICPDQD